MNRLALAIILLLIANTAQASYTPANPLPTANGGRADICQSSTPTTIYGASGASAQTVATCTIPANTIQPNSVLELDLHANFPTPNNAGRLIIVNIGGVTVGQTFPTATMGSIEAKQTIYVGPDNQSEYVLTQSLNNVSSPSNGQGAPYQAQTGQTTSLAIDFTQTQTLTIQLQPQNNDIATLTGFSLTDHTQSSPINYSPSIALASFGDSLTSGTGSLGSFVLTTTGTTSNSSNSLTSVGSITGVLPGQVISGGNIPSGTIVTAATGSTITMSQSATGAATGEAITIVAGSWPQQLMYAMGGRPVANFGIAGQTSSQITTRLLANKIQGKYWLNVDWEGRNDVGSGTLNATVLGNLALNAANFQNSGHYLFLTVPPAANENVGGTNWNSIVALNSAMVAAYPSNSLDVVSTLTSAYTVNIPLKYHNSTNTTGTCSNGSPTLTVASATGLSNGMYVISPGSAAISDGSLATAPTMTISGTTVTLSSNCGSALSSAMVSFVAPTEVHLNDLGYSIIAGLVKTQLTTNVW